MANPYFQFKQFVVHHDRCAMKVGTDGVLLGAWADVMEAKTVLDVGTGSGLISLMLAQRKRDLSIDAIEIDEQAAAQATENVQNSPFASMIQCLHISLQDYAEIHLRKYDLIVSNPPFFARSLKSPDEQRTMARHTDSLYIEDLFAIASKLLNENGSFSVIYPWIDKEYLLNLAVGHGLYPSRIVNVLPTPEAQPKRVLMNFKLNKSRFEETNLVVELLRHVYSDEFIDLTKDFYLKM